LLKDKLDTFLNRVEKPARYIGGELNSTEKKDAFVRFALCFPDVYEVSMSHLGSKILYNVLNNREDTVCERVYAPWPDMEQEMRDRDIPTFSLENFRPLKEFDLVGFSLLYEMCYTNILTMLELAGIPFRASERGEDMPLIVCGGPCTCNPEPIAPFMDAVMIGDGEELIDELTEVYSQMKRKGACKRDILLEMAKIPGVYIPAFYKAEYTENGDFSRIAKLEPSAPDKVQRRVLKDLEHAQYIGKPIVPYLSVVHDRIALEIFRGCTRGCRFCQAGFIYRPVRERTRESLMKQADELLACTGYDEVSLFSLSSGDYSEIHQLVPEIINKYRDKRVSISLPSLRIDSFLKEDMEQMQSIRKAGLTFAPEAGTQRLRDVINKGVTEDDLLRSVRDAFEAGWTGVKLYFMLGLPTETDEDLLGIADLARKVAGVYYSIPKEQRGKGLRITVSVSSFVPKPFTPFQWSPQNEKQEIIRKQKLLKDALKGARGVEFAYHAPDISVLEAVMARGDRRIADVIEAAYRNGARFDSWDEHFKQEAWDKAFEECGLEVSYYANRERNMDEALPWEIVDILVTPEYFKREYKLALEEKCTRDCRKGCNGCFGDKYADYCKV